MDVFSCVQVLYLVFVPYKKISKAMNLTMYITKRGKYLEKIYKYREVVSSQQWIDKRKGPNIN